MKGSRAHDEAVEWTPGEPGSREPENTEAAARAGAGLRGRDDADLPGEPGATAEERGLSPREAGAAAAREGTGAGSPGVLAPSGSATDPAATGPAKPGSATGDRAQTGPVAADPATGGPRTTDPATGGPRTTDPVATAEPVAADPVAVADPVAPAPETPASAADGRDADRPLMAPSDRDELSDRLHRTMGRFVDDPPGAVDDACGILDEVGERITRLLAERRDAYRDATGKARIAEGPADAETERLRLALRDCRDLAERLLKL